MRLALTLAVRAQYTAGRLLRAEVFMVWRLFIVAMGLSVVIAGCFTEKPVPAICKNECKIAWARACEMRCGISRPPGCRADRCPFGGSAGLPDGGLADGGPADGGGSRAGAGSDEGMGGTPAPPDPCGDPCPPERPFCDAPAQQCVACKDAADCAGSSATRCFEGSCVACLDSADCIDPAAARCDLAEHVCAPCADNSDCSAVTDREGVALGVCDPADGQCVQCTGASFAACGTRGSAQLVCNSLERRCESQRTAGSKRLCGQCVADAECAPGMRCVKEVFAGEELGYVCLFALGSGPAAPPNCLASDAGQYRQLRADVTVDGQEVEVCALSFTTCLANGQFNEASCSGTDDNASCGEPSLPDSACASRDFGGGQVRFLCTPRCLSTSDCGAGFACNNESSRFCDLDESSRFCDLEPNTCYTPTDCNLPTGQVCDQDTNRCVP